MTTPPSNRTSAAEPAAERFAPDSVTIMLVVSDMRVSNRWYQDVLDAKVHSDYGATSVVLDLAGTWLLLVTGGEPTPDKPTVTLTPPLDANQPSTQLIFGVSDCHATYELLTQRGAAFLTPPVDHGSEIRAFFQDPDGHLFEISQH